MTKYTRSKAILSELIKQVFGVSDISMDTKAIVLLLAGALPSENFRRWIDQIPQLNPLNMHYKQINRLRCEFGQIFRDYIMLTALQSVDQEITSDELQSFIQSKHDYIYLDFEAVQEYAAKLPRKTLFFSKKAPQLT